MTTVRAEDHEGGVRLLTLDRPPANAIDESLLTGLDGALDGAAADPTVRAVVLTGAGAFFSGGFDFSSPARRGDRGRSLYDLYRAVHVKLLGLPKPTVAMLNGHAIAGGAVLVLACDYRLGCEGDYRVGLNEVAVGAAFPRAAMEIVQLRLPPARATELILGAALYPAGQAPRLGLVDELFPADVFATTVMRRAARLASLPREAFAHAKAAFVRDAIARIEAETPAQASATMAVWVADESRAARARQREKLGVKPA